MVDNQTDSALHPSGIYDSDGVLLPDLLLDLTDSITRGRATDIQDFITDLHESEVADILTALDPDHRVRFAELCGNKFDFESLTEVDDAIKAEILNALPTDQIVEGVRDLDTDDAVSILEDLPQSDLEEILHDIPTDEQTSLRQSLDYPDESAGRRMQTDFISVSLNWSVGDVIDHIRKQEDLPNRFYDIFTVNNNDEVLGILPLDILLRSQRNVKVGDIHNEHPHTISVNLDQEEAATILQQYDLTAAPVVDESNKLVGALMIDDVVDVLQEEADEDIRRLAGVGDEELSDSVFTTLRSRIGWLTMNLLTALLASWIIGLFQATIDQMVSLAVLMPLVASMGGNAGTQTMTVAVRALAEHDLDIYNAKRIIWKELFVSLWNGAAFALIMAVIAIYWFGPYGLGIIIGLAMLVNMVFAAMSGIYIPLTLHRFGIDPAIASGVFVTTVTDVVGFFAFLGLAALFLV